MPRRGEGGLTQLDIGNPRQLVEIDGLAAVSTLFEDAEFVDEGDDEVVLASWWCSKEQLVGPTL